MRSIPFDNENDGEIDRHTFELWDWKEKSIFLLFCIQFLFSFLFLLYSSVRSLIRKLYGLNERFMDFSLKIKTWLNFDLSLCSRTIFRFVAVYSIDSCELISSKIHNFSFRLTKNNRNNQTGIWRRNCFVKIFHFFSYTFSRNETDEWQLAVLHYVSDDNNNNDVKQLKNKKEEAQQKYSLLFWSWARARSHTAVLHSLSIIIYK